MFRTTLKKGLSFYRFTDDDDETADSVEPTGKIPIH